MSETTFKERVMKDLKGYFKDDIYILKTQEMGRRGVPDLLICLNGTRAENKGKFIAIELKIDGKRPDPLQEVILNMIRRSGGISFSTTPSQWHDHSNMLYNL